VDQQVGEKPIQQFPPEWEDFGQAEADDWWEARHRDHQGFDAVGYVGAGEAYNAWLYRVRRRLFRRHVAPLARSESSVLDVGSGTGFYVDRWREAGVRDVTGSDLSESAVRHLRAIFPSVPIDRFDIAGPAAELPRRRFDLISAFDLLFHLIDDAAYRHALANLARLTKPGGALVITENFRRAGPRRFASVQVNREEGEILEALDVAGFKVIERRPMFVLMNSPARGGRPLLHAWWQCVHPLLTRRPRAGAVLGPALYPLELASLAVVRDAPSTELAICRRAARPD
jgi:SAM-dependent methyltransferase